MYDQSENELNHSKLHYAKDMDQPAEQFKSYNMEQFTLEVRHYHLTEQSTVSSRKETAVMS